MDVTVIIVNYNTAQMVLDCVTSVLSQTAGLTFEIIVVDNGSVVDDVDKLRGDHRFFLIESDENVGFGRANNLGAEIARGEYLFLLNSDTLLENNAIGILHSFMQSNTACGISGGSLLQKDLSSSHSYHRWFPSILLAVDFIRRMVSDDIHKPLTVAVITGADLMIRRSLWTSLKGFDERFFMYYEDVDLCLRAFQTGFQSVFVPDARIIHLEGQSFSGEGTRYQRICESRFIYYRKHYGRLCNAFADFINAVTLAAGTVLTRLSGPEIRCSNMAARLRIYVDLMKDR